MTLSNELRSLRGEVDPTLEQRLEILESKVEDLEAVLMGALPLSRKTSGSFISWLRGLLHTHRTAPGSTISSGGIVSAGGKDDAH